MARYSRTYSASYEGRSAGSDGLDLEFVGEPIPQDKLITDISYSIKLSADYVFSSGMWQMLDMYIVGSNIRDGDQYESMGSSNRHTFYGQMSFNRADIHAFSSGSFMLHTKANCSGKPKSYMWDVTITVQYKDVYGMTDVNAPTSVEAGSSLNIVFSNPELSEVSHKINVSVNSQYTITKNVSLGIGNCAISIPMEWCNAFPQSTSGTITITVWAYERDGTAVGSTAVTVTLEVPLSVKPTIASIDVKRIAGGIPAEWGEIYVQGISGITVTANNCKPAYGSKIVSYIFGGIMNTTTQSQSCTLQTIEEDGLVYVSVKCIDQRGRQSDEFVEQIDVVPYQPPMIDGTQAYRCAQNGESNEQGTYVRVQAAVSFSSCGGRNAVTLSSYYRSMSDTAWKNGVLNMQPSTFYTFGGSISTNMTYQVRFVISDTFSTVEKIVTVSTSQWVAFFRRGGTAIGIGTKPRAGREYIVDISKEWKILHGDVDVTDVVKGMASVEIPDIVYSPSQPAVKKGRIWLEPKG